MKQKSSYGLGTTRLVAIEQHFPERERIINDDLACRILPFRIRTAVWLKLKLLSKEHSVKWIEKRFPGFWGGVMCRKRYIDDKVIAAAHGQAEKLVNLGAGFDTRAYRLPALARVPVWELDLPENIAAKRSRLRKVFKQVPAHVTLVPIDFECQELGAVLATHGYTADTKTFFIWEAVTQYLTEACVHKTFDFLANAPAASRLAFTYVRKDFIDGKVPYDREYVYEKLVLKDKSWRFGMDPRNVADFLDVYGWRVLEHLGYEELAERYLKPTGRKLVPTPLGRMVYAEKRPKYLAKRTT
jgi:methyltransferase (TIGR00027 family)